MIKFAVTMLVGTLFGYIFLRFKVPGGMMVGSIISVAILNISTDVAYMPDAARVISQIIAGAFVGINIEKSDLVRLKCILKPAVLLLSSMLALNIIVGFLIFMISPLDLMTSLMSAVPGGMTNIPLISEEMGADASKVALMQFVRLVVGIGFFPSMIYKVAKWKDDKEEPKKDVYERCTTSTNNTKYLIITVIVAVFFGIVGKLSQIPAAILVFSMISVLVLKLKTEKAYMPNWMRRVAQILAGGYIGSGIAMDEVLEIRYLIVPMIVLIVGYLSACYLLGNILNKRFDFSIKEGMLAATPAGASDMALIAEDIGVESADVIVLQIIRMIVVVSIFPQVIRFITLFLENI